MSWKLFSLNTCLDSVEEAFNYDGASVECVEGIGNRLIVGTSAGGVASYIIFDDEQTKCSSVCENVLTIPQNRPIVQLKALSATNNLLALADGNLFVLTLSELRMTGSPKMRSVSCFASNECPSTDKPFVIQIAFGLRRRQIAVCELENDRITTFLEVDTDDVPNAIVYDDMSICYATSAEYYIVDLSSRRTRSLLKIEDEQWRPIVKRIDKNEFFLTGLHNLGMFVTADGVSNRAPLCWNDDSPICIAVNGSHIIAVSANFISVYSVADQTLKQKFPFAGSRCLCECEGVFFVASRKSVYLMKPLHWEKQVEDLLNKDLHDEALEVARNAKSHGSKEAYFTRFRRIQQRCGFAKLAEGNWQEAHDLFLQSHVDMREVISLYSNLSPSTFVRSQPPLHNIADILAVNAQDVEWKKQCESFLISLLSDAITCQWTHVWEKDINNALLKLLSNHDCERFSEVLQSTSEINVSDISDWLTVQKRYFALAILDWYSSRQWEALKVFEQLFTGKLFDPAFSADSQFLCKLLIGCDDSQLIIAASRLLMQFDETAAVQALLHANNVEISDVEELFNERDAALLHYLEAKSKQSTSRELETRLGLLFVKLLSTEKDAKFDELLGRFRLFLICRNSYDAEVLLASLSDVGDDQLLFRERAILLGKCSLHKEAIELIVEREDLTFADEYCQMTCKDKDRHLRHELYSILLQTLLVAQEQRKTLTAPTLTLLNSGNFHVELSKLLPSIPNHWSLTSLKPFIMSNAAAHAHQRTTSVIGQELAKWRLQSLRRDEMALAAAKLHVLEDSRCDICGQTFDEPECVRCPNGIIVHQACLKSQCPTDLLQSTTNY